MYPTKQVRELRKETLLKMEQVLIESREEIDNKLEKLSDELLLLVNIDKLEEKV